MQQRKRNNESVKQQRSDNVKATVSVRKVNDARVPQRLLLKQLRRIVNARSGSKKRRRKRRKRRGREKPRLKRSESAVQRGHQERGYLCGLLLDRVSLVFAFGFNNATTHCFFISSSATSSKTPRSDSKASDEKASSPSKSRGEGKTRA